jgi:hypothetical protein
MSKSNQNLIRVKLNAGNVTLACYIALLDNVEYNTPNGTPVVNLANAYADVRERVAPTEWWSALSALAKQGKYQAASDEATMATSPATAFATKPDTRGESPAL